MEQKNEQEQQKQPLFREKSLERLSSPEQLHDYLRVTSPRLWMILGTIVALLVGFVVYASTTRMESTVMTKMEVYEFGGIGGTIPETSRGVITENMPVRIGGQTGTISNIITASGYHLKLALDGGQLPDGHYYLTMDGNEPNFGDNTVWLSCSNGRFLAEKTREESALINQMRSSGDVRVRLWSANGIRIVFGGPYQATVRLVEPQALDLVSVTPNDPAASLTAGVHRAEIGASSAGGAGPLQMNVMVSEYGDITAILPEGYADAVKAGTAITVDGQACVIDRITSIAGYKLDVVSETAPEDGQYRVTLAGADPAADGTPFLLVTSSNGRIVGALQEADPAMLEKLRSGDTAVSFWNEPGKMDFQGARLATFVGVEDYVSTSVSVTLDNPNAVLEPGVYDAEIVTESTTPISFLLN